MKSTRSLVSGAVLLLLVLLPVVLAQQTATPPAAQVAAPVAAQETPLARLQEGNQRFVSGHLLAKELVADRQAVAKGQQPYAIVLTCADSRVAPELLFDETLGKLFVVRVAGNVTDPALLGSIEYAAEHLHAHLLVVMGHDSCGAVTAALAGGATSDNLGAIVKAIAPAAAAAKLKAADPAATLATAVRANVELQVANVTAQSPVLKEMAEKHELAIVGAIYHLDSGKVEFTVGKSDAGGGAPH